MGGRGNSFLQRVSRATLKYILVPLQPPPVVCARRASPLSPLAITQLGHSRVPHSAFDARCTARVVHACVRACVREGARTTPWRAATRDAFYSECIGRVHFKTPLCPRTSSHSLHLCSSPFSLHHLTAAFLTHRAQRCIHNDAQADARRAILEKCFLCRIN